MKLWWQRFCEQVWPNASQRERRSKPGPGCGDSGSDYCGGRLRGVERQNVSTDGRKQVSGSAANTWWKEAALWLRNREQAAPATVGKKWMPETAVEVEDSPVLHEAPELPDVLAERKRAVEELLRRLEA